MATLRRVNTAAWLGSMELNVKVEGLRCLLVEPSSEQRESCAAQLRHCAYDVTTTGSAAEALEALAQGGSSASFDVFLAEGSTLLASKALREHVKKLPTIMICEAPKPEEVMQSIKLGVAEVLERPLCPLKLKNIWQHSVRRLMRSASAASQQQMQQGGAAAAQHQHHQHAGGAARKADSRAAAGRRSSQDLAATSQNGSSTAPELSFCPVTPITTTADSPQQQQQPHDKAGAGEVNTPSPVSQQRRAPGSPLDLAPPGLHNHNSSAVGSPMSCGTAPTFNHNVNNHSSKACGDRRNDRTTATSAPAAVNVHESALYAPPPSTPAPAAGALLRAGSNSGTLTSSDEAAQAAPAANNAARGGRVLGVKRKSKEMGRSAGATCGDLAADNNNGGASLAAQLQPQQQGDAPQPPPARRSLGSLEAAAAAATDAVVSGDDLLLPPGFNALVDELAGGGGGAAASGQLQLAPAGSSALDAAALNNGGSNNAGSVAQQQQQPIGPAVGLPAGMSWGTPLNPTAVAPGITPPIFPAPPGPVMAHPLAPAVWPMAPGMPPPPTPGMPGGMMMPPAGMLPPPMGFPNPMMGHPMMAAGNPFMPPAAPFGGPAAFGNPMMPPMGMMGAPGLPGAGVGAPAPTAPQLPALPMSMLMGACGGGVTPGAAPCGAFDPAAGMQPAAFGGFANPATATAPGCMPAGMAGVHHNMMGPSPCSPTPTDPSIINSSHLSEHSAQDMLGMGLHDATAAAHLPAGGGKGIHGGKMGRCESHQLLPSLLDDLMADGDADMELELDTLSLTADLAGTPAGNPACGGAAVAALAGQSRGTLAAAAAAAPPCGAAVAAMKRNDSLEDLISASVAAF